MSSFFLCCLTVSMFCSTVTARQLPVPCLALLTGCSLQIPAQKRPQPDAARLRALETELSGLKDILQLPGMCVGVVKDGQLIYSHAGGYSNLERKVPMTTEHLFQIASVTKTFTANLVMQYEEAGRANVDDYALDYRFIDIRFGYPYHVDANTKVRHFLSHTSEDGPGHSFVYNGQRFNFSYGMFEKAGGYSPEVDAYSQEVKKQILKPLGMTHSITGFPDRRSDSLFAHIATPYIFDPVKKMFAEDTLNYKWTRAYPATGILSNIGDLAKYAASYDRQTLITGSSYQKVTTPARLDDGSVSPYGIGWFTEEFAGRKIHWHYGHADSYAALFVRVPENGYTFIFLCNSNASSEALRLGAGHIWQSPFVTAFLKHIVFPGDPEALRLLRTEASVGRALFLGYAQQTFGTHGGGSQQIIRQLAQREPARFDVYEPALIHLLTSWKDPSFASLTDRLAHAYDRYGHVQPYCLTDLAQYYEAMGNATEALRYYRQLADAKGFESWTEATDACLKTGRFLIQSGKVDEGRRYFWKAVINMKTRYQDDDAIRRVISQMNSLTEAQKN